RVSAALAENRVDEIGCAIEHTGGRGEAWGHVQHAFDAHDALYLFKIAGRRLELGDGIEGREAAGFITLLGREILADLTLVFEIAVDPWQLPRCVEHVADDRPWHIIRHRPRRPGKRKP